MTLATAIAETSLTLDGVSVVVDAGLSRRAEFDRAAGVTRLVPAGSTDVRLTISLPAGWQKVSDAIESVECVVH